MVASAPHSNTHRRSLARTAVVWAALQEILAPLSDATVVDIGGGTGGFAVPVAELGHRVTVVDPNPDALATLGRRAEESGVAERITAVQGDLAELHDLVPAGTADLVLCHGVLEIVDPTAALDAIADVLRPDGMLSLLVGQRHAAVVARAMAGHFVQAKDLLDQQPERSTPHPPGEHKGGGHRYTSDEIAALLAAAGFELRAMHAVRVFVDLVPGSLLDLEPGAAEALVALEQAVSERPEYLTLGTQLHCLATVAGS